MFTFEWCCHNSSIHMPIMIVSSIFWYVIYIHCIVYYQRLSHYTSFSFWEGYCTFICIGLSFSWSSKLKILWLKIASIQRKVIDKLVVSIAFVCAVLKCRLVRHSLFLHTIHETYFDFKFMFITIVFYSDFCFCNLL